MEANKENFSAPDCNDHKANDNKEILLGTRGACFLCLVEIETTGGKSNREITEVCLKDICRFLEVNPRSILLKSLEESLVENEKMEEVASRYNFSVQLCQICAAITNKFSQLILQVEQTTMRMSYKLRKFHKVLTSAEQKITDSDHRWKKVHERMSDSPVELQLVQTLRRETTEKCYSKLQRSNKFCAQNILLYQLSTHSSSATDVCANLSMNSNAAKIQQSIQMGKNSSQRINTESSSNDTVGILKIATESQHVSQTGINGSEKLDSVRTSSPSGPNILNASPSPCPNLTDNNKFLLSPPPPPSQTQENIQAKVTENGIKTQTFTFPKSLVSSKLGLTILKDYYEKLLPENRYKCLVCNQTQHRKHQTHLHMICKHPEKIFAECRRQSIPEAVFHHLCKRILITTSLQGKTVFSKHENQPCLLLCPYCEREFVQDLHRKYHLATEHYHHLNEKLVQLQDNVYEGNKRAIGQTKPLKDAKIIHSRGIRKRYYEYKKDGQSKFKKRKHSTFSPAKEITSQKSMACHEDTISCNDNTGTSDGAILTDWLTPCINIEEGEALENISFDPIQIETAAKIGKGNVNSTVKPSCEHDQQNERFEMSGLISCSSSSPTNNKKLTRDQRASNYVQIENLPKDVFAKYYKLINTESNLKRHKCLVCDEAYSSILRCHRHFLNHHLDMFFPKKRPTDMPEEMFRRCCEETMNFAFTQAERLKIYSDKMPILCPYCTQKCGDEHTTKFHLIMNHYNVLDKELTRRIHDDLSTEGQVSPVVTGTYTCPNNNSPPPQSELHTEVFTVSNSQSTDNDELIVAGQTVSVVSGECDENICNETVTNAEVNGTTANHKCLVCLKWYNSFEIVDHMATNHPENLFAHKKFWNLSQDAFQNCCIKLFSEMEHILGIQHGSKQDVLCPVCSLEITGDKLRYHLVAYHCGELEENLLKLQQNAIFEDGIAART